MNTLQRVIRKVCLYEVVQVSRTGGGREIKVYLGKYRKRFWFQLATENPSVMALVFIALGLTVALGFLGYGQAFSRMGAFVVLGGVVFSMYCVRKIDSQLNEQTYEILLKYAQEIAQGVVTMHAAHSGYRSPVRQAASQGQISSAVRQLTRKADREKVPFYITELVLAIVGTLIWAFGDWLICSLHSWSLNTCSP